MYVQSDGTVRYSWKAKEKSNDRKWIQCPSATDFIDFGLLGPSGLRRLSDLTEFGDPESWIFPNLQPDPGFYNHSDDSFRYTTKELKTSR